MSHSCATPAMYIPPAAQAALRADPSYMALLEAESTWAFKYHFTGTNPTTPLAHPIAGQARVAWGPGQADAYNSLLPQHYRVQHRASQNRPQTELFGTAPYMALGRGILNHVDVSTKLQMGNWVTRDGSRHLAERQFYRPDFVMVPETLRNHPVDPRRGEGTRVSPEYLQPHE